MHALAHTHTYKSYAGEVGRYKHGASICASVCVCVCVCVCPYILHIHIHILRLDLAAVQVDAAHAVDAHGFHHLGHVGRRDGHAAAVLTVLPRIPGEG